MRQSVRCRQLTYPRHIYSLPHVRHISAPQTATPPDPYLPTRRWILIPPQRATLAIFFAGKLGTPWFLPPRAKPIPTERRRSYSYHFPLLIAPSLSPLRYLIFNTFIGYFFNTQNQFHLYISS